jgi:ABC-2 type transport system ATP-binding protein
MGDLAIETKELNYSFAHNQKVVDGVTLQVPDGSIYGFLGPNGAGKTTTIRLLSGMLLSDNDNIFIHGKSLRKGTPGIFHSIGCLIETPSLYLHLTGKENLKVITTLRGMESKRIDAVLSTVRLTDATNRKVKEYSLGMKQRLGVAMALLPDPSLLMLDEPVNGLDPNGIIEIRELLIQLNKEEGKTVFISSHLLHEIEKTCTHIGIINRGVLRYQGTLQDMKNTAYSSGEVVFQISEADQWIAPLKQNFIQARRQSQNEIIFPFTHQDDVVQINQKLVQMKVPVSGIQIRGGLEEWFMQIISNDKQTV